MNNELAQREPLEVQAKRAELMAGAGEVLPRTYRNNPAALLVAFEYADALNIPRVNALTSIHLVDGKPTASADLIGALVRRACHKLRVTCDETYAEAVIIRADDPDFIPAPIRWDEQRARKAGLWGKKGPWQNYPGAMMRSRAITEAARMWAAWRLYVTELRADPSWLAADQTATGEPPSRERNAPTGVLLARLRIPVLQNALLSGSRWQVASGETVVVDDSERPFLVQADFIKEHLLCSACATHEGAPIGSTSSPTSPTVIAAGDVAVLASGTPEPTGVTVGKYGYLFAQE